jgi:hypothetical protein
MIASIESILSYAENLKKNYDKLISKGNKSAGKRARKDMLLIMKTAKLARKEVSQYTSQLPKKRSSK